MPVQKKKALEERENVHIEKEKQFESAITEKETKIEDREWMNDVRERVNDERESKNDEREQRNTENELAFKIREATVMAKKTHKSSV